MSQIINAIFENGVFRPSQSVSIKEHEHVTIKIVPLDDWQTRFNKIIVKIHAMATQYTPDEIQADVDDAVKEVRKRLRDC
jgi:predicted DNA-binding antitoxin AbrB/MazE fold protein